MPFIGAVVCSRASAAKDKKSQAFSFCLLGFSTGKCPGSILFYAAHVSGNTRKYSWRAGLLGVLNKCQKRQPPVFNVSA